MSTLIFYSKPEVAKVKDKKIFVLFIFKGTNIQNIFFKDTTTHFKQTYISDFW